VLRLTADELVIIVTAIENSAIKGKDAPIVAKVLVKLYKEFERVKDKEIK